MKKQLILIFVMLLLVLPIIYSITKQEMMDIVVGVGSSNEHHKDTVVSGVSAISSRPARNYRAFWWLNTSNYINEEITNAEFCFQYSALDGVVSCPLNTINITLRINNASPANSNNTLTWNTMECGTGEPTYPCTQKPIYNKNASISLLIDTIYCINITDEVSGEKLNDSFFSIQAKITPTDCGINEGVSVNWYWNQDKIKRPYLNLTFGLDSTPPIITIDYPSNNSRVNDIPLNFNLSVSDNGDNDITCILRNETYIFDEKTHIQNDYFLMEVNTTQADRVYTEIYNITCFDNTNNNNSKTELINLTIDTSSPQLTINSPVNNSYYQNTLSIDLECYDNAPHRLNYTFYNSSTIIKSVENNTPLSQTLILKDSIDIINYASGNYLLDVICADSHTSKEIPNYDISKNETDKKITYNNKISVELSQSEKALNNFDTYKQKDRYVFYYDFGKKQIGKLNTYKFRLKANNLKYLKDSNFNGHFITENKWIDFQLEDKNAKYEIKKIDNNEYEITIITELTYLNFKSIGDLNVVEKTYNIYVNNNPPIINVIYPLNDSYVNSNNFNFQINANHIFNNDLYCELSSCACASKNLKAFWRFEEGSGTNATDSSNNNYYGDIQGATYVSSKGTNNVGSYALSFDGNNDYVNLPSLPVTTNLSISAWIKLNKTTGTQGICTSGEEASSPHYLFQVYNDKLRLYVKNAYYTSNTPLSTGIWYFVAFAGIQSTGGKLYLNGNEDGSVSSWSTGSGNSTSIGRSGATNYFKGYIDEVVIYNYKLTQQEITDIYNRGISEIHNNSIFPQGIINLSFSTTENELTDIFKIECFDNTPLNLSSYQNINITIDTINPQLTINSPTDNEYIDKTNNNLTINSFCTDNLLKDFNVTFYNSTYSETFYNTSPNNNKIITNKIIDLKNIGIGTYNLLFKCNDLATNKNEELYTINIIETIPTNITLIYPENNTIDYDGIVDFKFTDATISNASLYLDLGFGFKLNKTITTANKINTINVIFKENYSVYWFVNSTTGDSSDKSETWFLNVSIIVPPITEALSIKKCPTDTPTSLIFLGFIGLALFFIFIGFMFRIGIMGILGSILLMIMSWYMYACISLFGVAIGGFSLILLIWFALSGLGFVQLNKE